MTTFFYTVGGIAAANAFAFLAEAATPDSSGRWTEFVPLLNFGGVAAVLGWFMFRMEPRMRSNEETIAKTARVNLVVILAIGELSSPLKTQAAQLLKELDEDAAIRNHDKKP